MAQREADLGMLVEHGLEEDAHGDLPDVPTAEVSLSGEVEDRIVREPAHEPIEVILFKRANWARACRRAKMAPIMVTLLATWLGSRRPCVWAALQSLPPTSHRRRGSGNLARGEPPQDARCASHPIAAGVPATVVIRGLRISRCGAGG